MSAEIELTTSPLEPHAESEGSQKVEAKISKVQSTKEGEIRHSNPFLADGVLSRKADYIITHSTITRTELHIADPDLVQPKAEVTSSKSPEVYSDSGVQKSTDERTLPVEVEVRQTTVDSPSRQRAEEVKLGEKKKCKCCVVV